MSIEIALWPYPERYCSREHSYMRRKLDPSNCPIQFYGYKGPDAVLCEDDLEKEDLDFFSDLSPGDTISLCGHCAPGLPFLASPDKRVKAWARDIAILLMQYGFNGKPNICVRGCNSAVTKHNWDYNYTVRSFVLQLKSHLKLKTKGKFKGKILGSLCEIPNGVWPEPGNPYFIEI